MLFVQTPQLSKTTQTYNFYSCGYINQSCSHGSLLTCLFIGIHFINLRILWCGYLHVSCGFEVPRSIYNAHRCPCPSRPAAEGQVGYVRSSQCHKSPKCGQLDQTPKFSQNGLCPCCLCCVGMELGCLLVSELMCSKCSQVVQVFIGARTCL